MLSLDVETGGAGKLPLLGMRTAVLHTRAALPCVCTSMMTSYLQVAAEPAALQRAPIVVKDWAALIGAVEELIMRVSALESLLEGRSQHLRSAFFTKFFGVDLLPDLRQVPPILIGLGPRKRCDCVIITATSVP